MCCATRFPIPPCPEWVGVQTQGTGVWLGMEVSRWLGVWANVYSPYPRAMIEKIFHLVLKDDCPDTTLFEPGHLTWAVMALLPAMLSLPEFSSLASYLAGDPRGIKRFQLSGRIAETFDRYAVYRPDMVLAWEAGKGAPGEEWQPILWRALTEKFPGAHVAAWLEKCRSALRKMRECPEGLPPRISLFGLSTLPPLYVDLLAGLPDCVSVNLFLLSPSREYWAHIRSRREIIREKTAADRTGTVLDEVLALEEGNRLLASLGRLGRDFQGILESSTDYQEPGDDLYGEPEEDSLLHQLQADILNLCHRREGSSETPLFPWHPAMIPCGFMSATAPCGKYRCSTISFWNSFRRTAASIPTT